MVSAGVTLFVQGWLCVSVPSSEVTPEGSTCLCTFGVRLAQQKVLPGAVAAVTRGCGQEPCVTLHRLPAQGPAHAASPEPLVGWSCPALQGRAARLSLAGGVCAGWQILPQPSPHVCCTIHQPWSIMQAHPGPVLALSSPQHLLADGDCALLCCPGSQMMPQLSLTPAALPFPLPLPSQGTQLFSQELPHVSPALLQGVYGTQPFFLILFGREVSSCSSLKCIPRIDIVLQITTNSMDLTSK